MQLILSALPEFFAGGTEYPDLLRSLLPDRGLPGTGASSNVQFQFHLATGAFPDVY